MLAAFGALLLAALSTVALVKYVKGAKNRALSGEELVDVLVVKSDIKAGTAAAELADRVSAERVPAKVRAANAVSAFKQIEGLVTSTDMVAGEQLLSSRFINAGSFQGARNASGRIPEGANELTLKLAPERALGGQLRAGDTVTMVASFPPFDNEIVDPKTGEVKAALKSPNTAHVILNKAVVVRLQIPQDASANSKEKNGVGVAPTQDLLVTLAVDQPSLERAVFAAEWGKVWLSYEPKTANSTKNREVTRKNVYEPTQSLLPVDTLAEATPLNAKAAPAPAVGPSTTKRA